ncbi:hypothetical protein DSM110093_04236 (plasmid) [Sulfitobacter sp. DSM 110093]|uniref:histidine kinase n=1 Tax=Sulfitobacter sp. DSM 110093 TaxID=2883127 RepID=UPI001FAB5557|nr:histidine kinase [Sulfitobacter sp. DSM 110093]UOA34400.1 hypothetical protein DSM110093_04236 [Sulfitobacter sp. DSM 110093]
MDRTRNEELKVYQRQRAAKRRALGIVSRTVWILASDEGRFKEQVAALVDHARLIEAVTGGPHLSAIEIAEIISRHNLPYVAEDLIYLSRVRETFALDPQAKGQITDRARDIVERYQLQVSVGDLFE